MSEMMYLRINKSLSNFLTISNAFSFKINLRKKKCVLFSVYRPPTQYRDNLLENLGHALDNYSENYENFMFLRDFDMTETEEQLKNFLDLPGVPKESIRIWSTLAIII